MQVHKLALFQNNQSMYGYVLGNKLQETSLPIDTRNCHKSNNKPNTFSGLLSVAVLLRLCLQHFWKRKTNTFKLKGNGRNLISYKIQTPNEKNKQTGDFAISANFLFLLCSIDVGKGRGGLHIFSVSAIMQSTKCISLWLQQGYTQARSQWCEILLTMWT